MANSLGNLAFVRKAMGAYSEAKALHERALIIREKALGSEHIDVALSLAGLGEIALEQDQPAEAVMRLERAVAIFGAHDGTQDGEAETRFNFARALARTGDRTRAITEALNAADGFSEAGKGMARELEEVETFLIEQGNSTKQVGITP